MFWRSDREVVRILNLYSGNLYGGVERMLVAMARSGEFPDAVFGLCFDGRLSAELTTLGARVVRLPSARARDPLSVLRLRRALSKALRRESHDAVICHGIWSYCMAASVVRRAGGEPVLFLHDVPEPQKLIYRWGWLRPPRRCIVNSAFVEQAVIRLGGDTATRIVHPLVLREAPPTRARALELRSALGAHEDDVIITQASRLDAWKGHRTLLRALGALQDLPRWRAWIAGSPQREEERRYLVELQSLAEQLGVAARVSFIGHRSDMSAVLAASDIYCQPNEQPEPFGMVFVEALAAGRPVVASNAGGVREIVNAECGLLCVPEHQEVSQALRLLLTDPALRESLGRAGRDRAAKLCSAASFRAALFAALR